MAAVLYHNLHAVHTDSEQVFLQGQGVGIAVFDPLVVDAEITSTTSPVNAGVEISMPNTNEFIRNRQTGSALVTHTVVLDVFKVCKHMHRSSSRGTFVLKLLRCS